MTLLYFMSLVVLIEVVQIFVFSHLYKIGIKKSARVFGKGSLMYDTVSHEGFEENYVIYQNRMVSLNWNGESNERMVQGLKKANDKVYDDIYLQCSMQPISNVTVTKKTHKDLKRIITNLNTRIALNNLCTSF